MIAHVIENGVVVNTIEVESLNFASNLVEATSGGIGWTYSDGKFTPPPAPEPVVELPPTKEELLAQLQALQAQINGLE